MKNKKDDNRKLSQFSFSPKNKKDDNRKLSQFSFSPKNKKGEPSTGALVGIIILVLSFAILLILLFRVDLKKNIDKEICHNSVILKSTVIASQNVMKDVVPLKCKTQVLCLSKDGTCEDMVSPSIVKVKTKEEVYNILAEELASCWWMFGEGQIDYVGKEVLADKNYCSLCSQIAFDNSIKEIKDLKLSTKVYSETGKIDDGCNACYPVACEGICINDNLDCSTLKQSTSLVASSIYFAGEVPGKIDCSATIFPYLCSGTNICVQLERDCAGLIENSVDKVIDISGVAGSGTVTGTRIVDKGCPSEFPVPCDTLLEDKCTTSSYYCQLLSPIVKEGEECETSENMKNFPFQCDETLCVTEEKFCNTLQEKSIDRIKEVISSPPSALYYRTKECIVEVPSATTKLDRGDFFKYLADTKMKGKDITYWEYLYTPAVKKVENQVKEETAEEKVSNLAANNMVRMEFLRRISTVYKEYQSKTSQFIGHGFSGTMLFSEVFAGRKITEAAGFTFTKSMEFPQFSQPITGYPDGSTNHFWNNVNDQKVFTRVPLDNLEEGDIVFARKTCSVNPSDFDVGIVNSSTLTNVTVYLTNRKSIDSVWTNTVPDTDNPIVIKTFNKSFDMKDLTGHIYRAFRYTEKLSESEKDKIKYVPWTTASAIEQINEMYKENGLVPTRSINWFYSVEDGRFHPLEEDMESVSLNPEDEYTPFINSLILDGILLDYECTEFLNPTMYDPKRDIFWVNDTLSSRLPPVKEIKLTATSEVQLDPINLDKQYYVVMGIASETSDFGKFLGGAAVGAGTILGLAAIYGTGGLAAPFVILAKATVLGALTMGASTTFLTPAFEGDSGNIFIRPDLVEASSDYDRLNCKDVKTLG
jgi:hypothetical protein